MVTAGSLRILLVEPETLRSQVLQAILQGLDVSATVVRSGFQGMQRLGSSHFDVVVIAEHLPDMAGSDLARTIRDLRGAPVVVLGLADGCAARQAFLDAGADDLMPAVPEFDGWMACLRRVEGRLAVKGELDRAVLETWLDDLGEELYEAVVRDYLEAGTLAMARLHRAIASGDAGDAASMARIFGSHSRAVGAPALRGLMRAWRAPWCDGTS